MPLPPNFPRYPSDPEVWVSLSVCWSGNTDKVGGVKSEYPYTYAAKLCVSLWRIITGLF